METELNAVREKLLAEKTSVELELKTVNEDLTNQLTQATSQVGKTTQFIQFLIFYTVLSVVVIKVIYLLSNLLIYRRFVFVLSVNKFHLLCHCKLMQW